MGQQNIFHTSPASLIVSHHHLIFFQPLTIIELNMTQRLTESGITRRFLHDYQHYTLLVILKLVGL